MPVSMIFNRYLGILVPLSLLSYATCQIQRYEGIQLNEYKSYRDVVLNEYEVKENTKFMELSFIMYAIDDTCELPKATIYVQYGGFPLVNPLNTTYPADFYTTHESYDPFIIPLEEEYEVYNYAQKFLTRSIYYDNPRSGSYFIAAYLNPQDKTNSAIRPKGLFSTKSCIYVLQSNMKYAFNEDSPPPILKRGEITTFSVTNNRSQQFSIEVPDNSQSLRFQFTCSSSNSNESSDNQSNSCAFVVEFGPELVHCDIENSTSDVCLLVMDSPSVGLRELLTVSTDNPDVNLTVLLSTEDVLVQSLSLYQSQSSGYKFRYYNMNIASDAASYFYLSVGSSPHTVSFNIIPLIHSGGTLKFEINAEPNSLTGMIIHSCLSLGKINTSLEHLSDCSKKQQLTIDTAKDNRSARMYLPYPVAGKWFVSVVRQCYNINTSKPIQCTFQDTVITRLYLNSEPCVEGSCSNQGECYQYVRNYLQWSTCKCKAGYRGYGCTDASKAETNSLQLATVLFLTLSNVLFIMSALVALRYKWFTESLVYLFVLFSSTFYHACDNGTLHTLCIYRYNVLQYCDFYGSLLAVWFTAMALAKISYKVRSFFHMLGVLGIMMGTQFTLDGLWNFVIPLIIASTVLVLSWIRMCVMKRACYPTKRVWLIQVVPGAVCALVGVGLYTFVETDSNYYYTHSIWHLLMASAVCFLLPRKRKLQPKAVLAILRSIFRRDAVESYDLEMDSDESPISDSGDNSSDERLVGDRLNE